MLSRTFKTRASTYYSWAYWDDGFSDQDLQAINTLAETAEVMRGRIGSNDTDETIRKSDLSWLYHSPDTDWLFKKMDAVVEQINFNFYELDLWGYDALQYTRYRSEEHGKYDQHMDMFLDKDTSHLGGMRKLSLSLLLNDDFEGGEFEFCDGEHFHKIETKKGRVIAFPSWLVHRVRPVTSGQRLSVVTWVSGPKLK